MFYHYLTDASDLTIQSDTALLKILLEKMAAYNKLVFFILFFSELILINVDEYLSVTVLD